MVCLCGQPATLHTSEIKSVTACHRCALAAGVYDGQVLPPLAERIAARTTKPSRSGPAMAWRAAHPRRTPWRRDKLMVVARWLRRYVGGAWYRGGHHVGRLNYGPFVGEQSGRWFASIR